MGNTLREIRQQKGKVLFDMAKATNLHASTIHRIEHGQLPQSFERIEVLAQCYELDVSAFVEAVYAAYKNHSRGVLVQGLGPALPDAPVGPA